MNKASFLHWWEREGKNIETAADTSLEDFAWQVISKAQAEERGHIHTLPSGIPCDVINDVLYSTRILAKVERGTPVKFFDYAIGESLRDDPLIIASETETNMWRAGQLLKATYFHPDCIRVPSLAQYYSSVVAELRVGCKTYETGPLDEMSLDGSIPDFRCIDHDRNFGVYLLFGQDIDFRESRSIRVDLVGKLWRPIA